MCYLLALIPKAGVPLSFIARRSFRSNFKPRTSFGGALEKKDYDLVIWLYGGVWKSPNASHEPLVDVIFRRLDPDGTLHSTEVIPVALSFLGQLRIGTCWRAGRWAGEIQLEDLGVTAVNLRENVTWRFVQLRDTLLVSDEEYGLKSREWPVWLVEVDGWNEEKILIPCVEFFIRCYGRNSESARILATYPWDMVLQRFFYDFPTEPSDQRIQLKNWVSSSEGVFLWHLLHDPTTRDACKRIYAELDAQFGPATKHSTKAYLKAGPWFEGTALLMGKGRWLADGKTFLCLQLTGFSDPKGPVIDIERSSFVTDGTHDGGWHRQKRVKELPENQRVSLTDAEPPDVDSETLRVPNYPIHQLGDRRRIRTTQRTHKGSNGNVLASSNGHALHAPGEGQGSSKGVGSVEFQTQLNWESQGDLKAMWAACGLLAEKYTDIISSVEWFTFERGYQTIGPPELELLRPLENASLSPKVRNWPYLDVRERVMRGLLIIRIRAGLRSFYIIESQRRPRYVAQARDAENASNAETEDAAGHQCLLLEISAGENDTRHALKEICSNIRYVQGQVRNIRLDAGFPKITFNHSKRAPGEFLFEGVLVSKLAELNLKLETKVVN